MGNVFCEMTGIGVPIVLGGMLFFGKAELVAAVSAAGGLGLMGAGAMEEGELREEIARVRDLTDRPFGFNVPVRSPRAETLDVALQMAQAVIQSGATGLTVGRNIWSVPQITKAVEAFLAVVHDEQPPEQALQNSGL